MLVQEIWIPCHYHSKIIFSLWRKHSILKIMKWKSNLKVSIYSIIFLLSCLQCYLRNELEVHVYLLDIFLKVYNQHSNYSKTNYSASSASLICIIFSYWGGEIWELLSPVLSNYCEKVKLLKIWEKNHDKLPKDVKIDSLMLKWDTLSTSWLQNDILGCIIPNNPSKV